jgi:hypothetical protein
MFKKNKNSIDSLVSYTKKNFFEKCTKKNSTFIQKKIISVEAAEVLQYPTHKGLTRSLY